MPTSPSRRLLLAASLAGVAVLVPLSSRADGPPRPVAARTTRTADYVEQNVGGEEVVKFTGDELVAPAGGAYGDVIRRPPGVVRVGLIRPRMNFVSELLKSVENL